VEVSRRYYACRECKATQLPWDVWAGLEAIQVTPHARKMITTVATVWSFDRASRKLKDICCMNVSDDTIERVCQHEGEQVRRWLRGDDQTARRSRKRPASRSCTATV
jgi:hypothetical protein